jgi:hypothetical protein
MAMAYLLAMAGEIKKGAPLYRGAAGDAKYYAMCCALAVSGNRAINYR